MYLSLFYRYLQVGFESHGFLTITDLCCIAYLFNWYILGGSVLLACERIIVIDFISFI